MRTSESIAKIVPALVLAQSQFPLIGKDARNPELGNKYATLDKIVEEIRPILFANRLGTVQGAEESDGRLIVTTTIIHDSGEWIESAVVMPLVGRMLKGGARAEPDPQSAGSAVSYGRRYGICAALGLVTGEDDDGNAASRTAKSKASRPAAEQPASKQGDGMFFGKPRGTPLGQYDDDTLKKIIAWLQAKDAEKPSDKAKETIKTARAILADRSLGLDDDSTMKRVVEKEDAFQGALNR